MGLTVHFFVPDIYYSDLDEDDGADELYVRMSYFDCHSGQTRSYWSDNLVGQMG